MSPGAFVTPPPRRTNWEVFRLAKSPLCEWFPSARREARLSDPYHGIATLELTGPGSSQLRVCADCADQYFPHRGTRPIRRWGAS